MKWNNRENSWMVSPAFNRHRRKRNIADDKACSTLPAQIPDQKGLNCHQFRSRPYGLIRMDEAVSAYHKLWYRPYKEWSEKVQWKSTVKMTNTLPSVRKKRARNLQKTLPTYISTNSLPGSLESNSKWETSTWDSILVEEEKTCRRAITRHFSN